MPPTIEDHVRRIMRESGVSNYRLAIDSGVKEASLSRFRNRKRGLSIEAVDAIARALGFRVEFVPLSKPHPPKGR